MGVYFWTLGEIALARISQKVYEKVRISKNEEGLFHDEKVLGLSLNEDGALNVTTELCYFVEFCRTKDTMWLPYTCLHLAERSRPYYGDAKTPQVAKPVGVPRKRKIKEEHPLPLQAAKLANLKTPDLNTTFDFRQLPLKIGTYENAFKAFLRRGNDSVFDEFYFLLQKDPSRSDDWNYIHSVDASTEDKFEMVIRNVLTEKEVKNYLKSCWRYHTVLKLDGVNKNNSMDSTCSDTSAAPSPAKPVTVHSGWCLVCGGREDLDQCSQCPASYHQACSAQWRVTVMHRRTPSAQAQPEVATVTVERVLSSTRSITSSVAAAAPALCPSCQHGPRIGYGDVIWHKLGACPWWPARVLSPGELPACLLARRHAPDEWPVIYYGELKYSWVSMSRAVLFLPSHAVEARRGAGLRAAVLDAEDDYIRVYLT